MRHPLPIALSLFLVVGGCMREASLASPSTSAASVPPSAPAAYDALDRMDARTAVPLLPTMANHQKQNMRDHLVAVQEIVAALAVDDYAVVERAASRISVNDICSTNEGESGAVRSTCSRSRSGSSAVTSENIVLFRPSI